MYNIKSTIDIINDEMNKSVDIMLHESDFVDPNVKLSDTQVKQLFMVLSQASVYKKVQGNLKGYKPSFKIDKVSDGIKPTQTTEDVTLNELDPFGGVSKVKDIFKAKFGDKGAKMAQVARNTAQDIWKKWENDAIEGGIVPTIETLSKWINNKGVDSDLIDVSFRAIGVPNIKATIRKTANVDRLPLPQWMDENNVTQGNLDGKVLKDYLLDIDTRERDIKNIFDSIGIKNLGTMVSKNQIKNLETILNKRAFAPKSDQDEPTQGEPVQGEPTQETPIKDQKPNSTWKMSDVYKHVINNYDVDRDDLSNAFKKLGTDSLSDEEIGDERLRKLNNAITGREKTTSTTSSASNSEEIMNKTQKIMQNAGVSVGNAKAAGQKAIKTGDYSNMSELQKLGIAILTARKKI